MWMRDLTVAHCAYLCERLRLYNPVNPDSLQGASCWSIIFSLLLDFCSIFYNLANPLLLLDSFHFCTNISTRCWLLALPRCFLQSACSWHYNNSKVCFGLFSLPSLLCLMLLVCISIFLCQGQPNEGRKNEALRSINGSRQLTTQTTKNSPTSPLQSFVEKPTPLSSWRARPLSSPPPRCPKTEAPPHRRTARALRRHPRHLGPRPVTTGRAAQGPDVHALRRLFLTAATIPTLASLCLPPPATATAGTSSSVADSHLRRKTHSPFWVSDLRRNRWR
jgi:hypothetical protein